MREKVNVNTGRWIASGQVRSGQVDAASSRTCSGGNFRHIHQHSPEASARSEMSEMASRETDLSPLPKKMEWEPQTGPRGFACRSFARAWGTASGWYENDVVRSGCHEKTVLGTVLERCRRGCRTPSE